jgi:hypothetical protein
MRVCLCATGLLHKMSHLGGESNKEQMMGPRCRHSLSRMKPLLGPGRTKRVENQHTQLYTYIAYVLGNRGRILMAV